MLKNNSFVATLDLIFEHIRSENRVTADEIQQIRDILPKGFVTTDFKVWLQTMEAIACEEPLMPVEEFIQKVDAALRPGFANLDERPQPLLSDETAS